MESRRVVNFLQRHIPEEATKIRYFLLADFDKELGVKGRLFYAYPVPLLVSIFSNYPNTDTRDSCNRFFKIIHKV